MSDSRQPYRLSNLDLVTESFTFMAGNRRVPSSTLWFNRSTPVVVSSETPTMDSTIPVHLLGYWSWMRFSSALMTASSDEVGGSSTQVLPCSSSNPLWINKVASPPSSTINWGPSWPAWDRAR